MNEALAAKVIDAIIADGWLTDIDGLIASRRRPSGRNPSATSLRLAELWRQLDDNQANLIARDLIDATTFSLLSLMDADFRNTGLHIGFEDEVSGARLDSRALSGELIEAYRARVDPFGVARDEVGTERLAR